MNIPQGKNGDADIENRLGDTLGEGESDENRKCIIDIYILPYAK